MKRSEFLKSIGVAGLGLSLPVSPLVNKALSQETEECVLIPGETAGPFPWDLTDNSAFFRQRINEEQPGVPLHLKMRIIGDQNCQPMQNVRVHIWHCNKDGAYSAYDNNMNPGQAGKTYCRGWQITDNNGEVEFDTIFPGWYNGRICHIHFQVYVSSVYAAISQLTFDIPTKNALYNANKDIYTKGEDPLTFSQDNIFNDGYAYQLASLSKSESNDGYESYIQVTVKGNGISGLQNAEPETGGHFTLYPNYPNPCSNFTNIPFTLHSPGFVVLELFTLNGKKVGNLLQQNLEAGYHNIPVSFNDIKIPPQPYAYQLKFLTNNQEFKQSKLLSVFPQ